MTNAASGLTFAAKPDGGGGTVLTATGPGITFNFIYDASVADAPAQFKQGLTLAARTWAG